MSLHFATHMDAPWHMMETGKRMDGIALVELIGEAVIIDVSEAHAPDKGNSREISRDEIQRFLSAHRQEVHRGDALLVHTGWRALFKTDPARYYAAYPTPSLAVCQWAVDAGIRLFGIDAPDLDPPGSYENRPFSPSNHRLLLGNDVYILENLGGQVASLLNQRVLLIPAPLAVGGEYASGAPVRLVAMTQG
jgi:kynurenine formamidase